MHLTHFWCLRPDFTRGNRVSHWIQSNTGSQQSACLYWSYKLVRDQAWAPLQPPGCGSNAVISPILMVHFNFWVNINILRGFFLRHHEHVFPFYIEMKTVCIMFVKGNNNKFSVFNEMHVLARFLNIPTVLRYRNQAMGGIFNPHEITNHWLTIGLWDTIDCFTCFAFSFPEDLPPSLFWTVVLGFVGLLCLPSELWTQASAAGCSSLNPQVPSSVSLPETCHRLFKPQKYAPSKVAVLFLRLWSFHAQGCGSSLPCFLEVPFCRRSAPVIVNTTRVTWHGSDIWFCCFWAEWMTPDELCNAETSMYSAGKWEHSQCLHCKCVVKLKRARQCAASSERPATRALDVFY